MSAEAAGSILQAGFPPSIPECHHTSLPLAWAFCEAKHEPHAPAQQKYLQQEHGEGCINTSSHCSVLPTDLISDVELERARHQLCNQFLREGVAHSQAAPLAARPCGWGTSSWHITPLSVQQRLWQLLPYARVTKKQEGALPTAACLPGQCSLKVRLQTGGLNVKGFCILSTQR